MFHGIDPALLLAPMEGITDAPMRAFQSERGGFTHCVSEFVRVSQNVLSGRVFKRYVPELSKGSLTPAGLAVQVQILGGHPERMAMSALEAVRAGAGGIDINFGCPAPTVNRNDGGATLLKFPDRLRDIVRAVREAVPRELPVSAKLRLGFDDMKQIYVNAERAAEGGASWITIHGRTKVQGYIPPAYWGPIGEVRRNLDIPVVANGEIWTLDDFKRCRDETGCEQFMLGRGALADPFLPLNVARELGLSAPMPARPGPFGDHRPEWRELMLRFVELSYQYAGGDSGYILARVKQWLRIAAPRQKLEWWNEAKRFAELDELLLWLKQT